ncbi:MAG: hypothetical protein JSS20_09940 [Proteobacteria bacterium]|nr:hypothetical protein [Pseudomonadota bacterium]
MFRSLAIAAVLAVGAATSAFALPAAKDVSAPSLVEKTAGWRYHASCAWRGGHWIVTDHGKEIACRPNKPHGSWVWRSEGGREGWYDARKKSWHYNKW